MMLGEAARNLCGEVDDCTLLYGPEFGDNRNRQLATSAWSVFEFPYEVRARCGKEDTSFYRWWAQTSQSSASTPVSSATSISLW